VQAVKSTESAHTKSQNEVRLIPQLSSDGAKESEGARTESILFDNPDLTESLVDYRPIVLA